MEQQTLQQQESFEIHGPQLEVLGEAETKLPAPLKKGSTASLIFVAVVLAAVVGIGGAKLRGGYNAVYDSYAKQSAKGYTISQDLGKSADAAANVIRMSGNLLGTDNAEIAAAQQALDNWNAVGGGPAEQYRANADLVAAVDAVYQEVSASAGSADAVSAIGTQYTQMTSQQDILRRETNAYNTEAQAYNKTAGSFPANLIGALWGAGKVELFG
jgi:hypothetical protein